MVNDRTFEKLYDRLKELEAETDDTALGDRYLRANDKYFFNTFFENDPTKAAHAAGSGDYNFEHEYVNVLANGNLLSMSAPDFKAKVMSKAKEIEEVYSRHLGGN